MKLYVMLFLCFLGVYHVTGQRYCPYHERLSRRGKACEPTCAAQDALDCEFANDNPACVCREGLVRNEQGDCVTRDQCYRDQDPDEYSDSDYYDDSSYLAKQPRHSHRHSKRLHIIKQRPLLTLE